MTSYGSIAVNGAKQSENDPSSTKETAPLIDDNSEKLNFGLESASLWSRLVFGWFGPLLELGNRKQSLDPEDLDELPLPTSCSTTDVTERFETYWNAERARAAEEQQASEGESPWRIIKKAPTWISSPSLVRALFFAFGADFMRAGALKLVHDMCIFVGPLVLNGLIHFLRDADAPMRTGLLLSLAVTISQLTMSFCLRHYFFICYMTGLRIRTSVVVSVYKKALVLASSERQTRSLGEITNLQSIDAQRMQDLTTYLHAIWYSFIQIGLALFLLFRQLGPSCLGGVVVILIMMPVTKYVAKMMGRMQKELMKAKDVRVDVNTEVLGSMKVIKLQAWEESFQKRIMELRDFELRQLLRYMFFNSLTIMMYSATPLVVALATFASYVLSGNELEVASALTALALFDILRFPLTMLPNVINNIVEASISLHRVSSFLTCDEYSPVDPGDLTNVGVVVDNGSFAYESRKPKLPDSDADSDPLVKELIDREWEVSLLKSQLQDAENRIRELSRKDCSETEVDSVMEDSSQANLLCLKRINFECKRGELVAIVGGVGCGKSSMLNAILGEVRSLSGETAVKGSLSYFSQNPFLLNATVRDNILFGHTNESVDESRYQRALTCCALRHDLQLLPAGDMTEIGEKGITLSGGQKARVALARAVYHAADICLLDDPLAAVDAHVGRDLFQQCIVDELLLNKGVTTPYGGRRTVILATNALQYLSSPVVDRIVVMQNGQIAEQGTYKELSMKSTIFSRFLDVLAATGVSPTSTDGCDVDGLSESEPSTASLNLLVDPSGQVSETAEVIKGSPQQNRPSRRRSSIKKDDTVTTDGALMTDELRERETGHVSASAYIAWARAAGGTWIPFVIIAIYVTVEGMNVLSKWWLTYWSERGGSDSQLHFLAIYALINFFAILGSLARLLFVVVCGLRASRKVFSRLLDVILRAPMSFFDTTPIGRITNRFSKDMYTVDEQLLATMRSYLATLFSVFSTIIVVSVVSPYFTLCLIPMIIFYRLQQNYFTMTYRELKRLDSVSRSPIYALLGETLDGVATIRAFSAQGTLQARLNDMLDKQQHAYYLTTTAQCWLAVRLELVGTLIITFACLCSVLRHNTMGGNETFAGLAGLSISYALSVTQSLNWSVRMGSDFESNMIALERIEQYCNIESEAPFHTEADGNLSATWPAAGQIKFENVRLRYRPGLPLVLKGLDIEIPAQSKIGVVGRTGAGKSTLMVALLRIVELDRGAIYIDGVNTRTVGLAKLRSKIAVIPQDPVLFSGTVRTNLDPFNNFQDQKLFDVLTRVGLYSGSSHETSNISLSSLAQAQIQSLSDLVEEGGSNFSVGQRQLLVIARALLCGASVVIMDEATAAVDADTDSRIQAVMRTEFKNATCITVAHRLNTILDSDLILVMDDGRAAEFDTPRALLSQGGMFSDLVKAASEEGKMF